MADIICNNSKCMYCFEGDCQRNAVLIQTTEGVPFCLSAEYKREPLTVIKGGVDNDSST